MPADSPQEKIDNWRNEPPMPGTVTGVFAALVRNPVRTILFRWNWKAALLSACIRGTIFFFANLGASLEAALGAMFAEFVFRTATSGFYGSVIQSFRCVRPAWRATLVTVGLLPLISHSLEFLVHYTRGTEKLTLSIAASISFTTLSVAFNLFAMRRGALVVDNRSDSLAQDLRRMPGILLEFCQAVFTIPLPWIRSRVLQTPTEAAMVSSAQKTTCTD
jgi:hypothetical protein